MKLTQENLREKDFHNKLQSNSKGRFENIFYKAISNMQNDFLDIVKRHASNKIILDYGCGIGNNAEKIANFNPLKLTAIDISDVSISKASEQAKNLGLNIDYRTMNCEDTDLEDETYDIIYGAGILHHLKNEKSLPEIARLLKSNGKLIFMEPLGTNPIINLYRKLTPNSRSIDEHPFTKDDFLILNKYFGKMKLKFYGFLTLVFFPFYSDPKNSKFFKFISCIDQILFKFSFFRLFAWSVLINGEK